MKRTIAMCLALVAALSVVAASESEITVDLRLASADYVSGESIEAVVDIANSSPDELLVNGKKDRFFVEVFRASDNAQLDTVNSRRFVKTFRLGTSRGQKFTVRLGDHYALSESRRYLAKPVLVHDGMRYEGSPRAFDVVDGIRITGAVQMFANRKGLRRDFSLVYWSRNGAEHIFLKASDSGAAVRNWQTRDLGSILRLDKPVISILNGGEVVILHRLNTDQFLRSELWSMPDALEFRQRETVRDPETAATARVRELYKEGGVKPVDNPWWKIW